MSLDYDLSKIPESIRLVEGEPDEHGPTKRLNPITEALIFATISVGMSEITEKNWKKFADRLTIVQNLDGGYLVRPIPEIHGGITAYITDEDVKNHIGLATNASNKTDAQFNKGSWTRGGFGNVRYIRDSLSLAELKLRAIKKLTTDRIGRDLCLEKILEADTVEKILEAWRA